MAATLQCRIQYLDDTDPFSSTNFPEPTRPPTYTFLTNVPLLNQVAGVKRLLKSPHKVSRVQPFLFLRVKFVLRCSSGNFFTGVDLEFEFQQVLMPLTDARIPNACMTAVKQNMLHA